jgi:hypothetical protein
MIRTTFRRLLVALMSLAVVLGLGVTTASTASALPNYNAYLSDVTRDYRNQTGRFPLWSAQHIKTAGAWCRARTDLRGLQSGINGTAGVFYGGDYAMAGATCRRAIQYKL